MNDQKIWVFNAKIFINQLILLHFGWKISFMSVANDESDVNDVILPEKKVVCFD